jgi:hypothetical protein
LPSGSDGADDGVSIAGTADFWFIKTQFSRRFSWNSSQPGRLCRGRIGRWPQFGDQPQAVGEEVSRDSNFGHLEGNIASVTDDLGADLDQLLLQAGQGPVADRFGCHQSAQEVAEIVSDSVQLKTDRIGSEC